MAGTYRMGRRHVVRLPELFVVSSDECVGGVEMAYRAEFSRLDLALEAARSFVAMNVSRPGNRRAAQVWLGTSQLLWDSTDKHFDFTLYCGPAALGSYRVEFEEDDGLILSYSYVLQAQVAQHAG